MVKENTSPCPLVLSEVPAGRIVAHVIASYPDEACGFLVGFDSPTQRTVTDALASENIWENRDERGYRFAISPAQQMQLERSLTGTGKSLIGFYHSHPDHLAQPSEFDREVAWTFYSYLILSVNNGQVQEMKSWVLDHSQQQFLEQTVRPLSSVL